MDYKTKPIGRTYLRALAFILRRAFGQSNRGYFDVVQAFEKVHQIWPNVTVEVVENSELPVKRPAECTPDFKGNYHIKVKESVYLGACRNIGAYRSHILHEICHAFLCIIGYTPILERAFKDNELEPYESMEWQAKALCGEILVPYFEIKNLSQQEIILKYGVSPSCAQKCIKNLKDQPIK